MQEIHLVILVNSGLKTGTRDESSGNVTGNGGDNDMQNGNVMYLV